jgi:hypothetical protein
MQAGAASRGEGGDRALDPGATTLHALRSTAPSADLYLVRAAQATT